MTDLNRENAASPYARATDYVRELRDQVTIGPTDSGKRELLPTCYRILLLEGLDELQKISQEERSSLRSYLTSCQLSADGIFQDSLHTEGKSLTPRLINYRSTCFSLQALDALGTKAPYRLSFMDEFKTAPNIASTLESWNWAELLNESEQLMCVLTSLIYFAETEQDKSAVNLLHRILDWLDERQDPKAGLWSMGFYAPLSSQVTVASRLVPFYEYVRRPLTRRTQMIDTILTGCLFQAEARGSPEDLATVTILAILTSQVGYRREEIKRTLRQIHQSVLTLQTDDGGFTNPPGISDRVQRSPEGLPTSDQKLESTWQRLVILATVEHLYPQEFDETKTWKFRRWPSHGYRAPFEKLSDHERVVLPLWTQPRIDAVAGQFTKDPAISVIIPCYNLGRYLPEAVDSVLAQTIQNFEIVVVNDGSTDEFTNLLLKQFEGSRVKVLHLQNQGLPGARNEGIRNTRGRYLCCLDADDRLHPRYFEKTLSVMESDPTIGFVSCYLEMFDEREAIQRYDQCRLPELLVDNLAVEAALFRRDAWEKAGGYCQTFSVSGIEDWDFWIALLELGYRAEVVPEVLFEYRIRFDSMFQGKTRRPENFRQLMKEMVLRHQESFTRYLPEVLGANRFRLASLHQWVEEQDQAKSWWENQTTMWKQQSEFLEKRLADHRQELKQLEELTEELTASLDEQRKKLQEWQSLAEKREEAIQEQKNWTEEVQKGKDWLENQYLIWKAEAERSNRDIVELKTWIGELEKGKQWLEEQTYRRQYSEERERGIEGSWRLLAGSVKRWLQEQATKWSRTR